VDSSKLLLVASPSTRNTQQSTSVAQQPAQQPTQQVDLKALAARTLDRLERNSTRNTPANTDATPRNNIDSFLDGARNTTSLSRDECRALFSPLDLRLIESGEMPIEAARHYLLHKDRTVCRHCLGDGCRECDYFGGVR
jgi:hypothetical protein